MFEAGMRTTFAQWLVSINVSIVSSVFDQTAVINMVLAYNVLKLIMKNSISYRGSIVWNLLEPSAVSARDYAERAKSLTP